MGRKTGIANKAGWDAAGKHPKQLAMGLKTGIANKAGAAAGKGRHSHAQSALEYFVTYGWSILAMVIISVSLWHTGVFDPLSFAGGGKSCGGFGSFACEDLRVDSSGTARITLLNKAGSQINSVSIASGNAGVCNPASVPAGGNVSCLADMLAPPGRGGTGFERTQVEISYIDAKSGIGHTESGTVQGKYEQDGLNPQGMQGLAGWWRFEQGSGIRVPDSTSSHNDGIIASTSPLWQGGPNCKFGGCLRFDGSLNHFVSLQPNFVNLGTSFTMTAWMYFGGPLGSYKLQGVFAQDAGNALFYKGLDRKIYYTRAGNSVSSQNAIPVGIWTHVAAAVGPSSACFYINGALDSCPAIPSTPLTLTALGGDGIPDSDETFFGTLDEMKVWSRTLSASEIYADYSYTGWTT